MNVDKLYVLVNTLRKYVTGLVTLDPKDANKLDASDWKYLISDVAMGLIVIEEYIKNEKGE